jgi:hypothetical protein
VDRTVSFGGDPALTYEVTLRFRGVLEARHYEGGTPRGEHFHAGGSPQAQTLGYGTILLSITAPPQTYYLNSDERGGMVPPVFTIDHTETILIQGGAQVRLLWDDPDCRIIRNCISPTATPCQPFVVPGIAPAPGSFDGEFAQMDVVSVRALR